MERNRISKITATAIGVFSAFVLTRILLGSRPFMGTLIFCALLLVILSGRRLVK